MSIQLVKKVGAVVLAILFVILPVFVFAQETGLVPCGSDGTPCTFGHLITLVNTIIDFLITKIALPVSAALFAWAGFLYLTAAGSDSQIKKAHTIFFDVFIGLALALSGWLIISLVTQILTGRDAGSFFRPGP